MKNLTRIPDYCDYSFDDLYKAAYKRNLKVTEKKKLQRLPQEEINKLVIIWAKKAGWATKVKPSSNGIKYLAFYPKYS